MSSSSSRSQPSSARPPLTSGAFKRLQQRERDKKQHLPHEPREVIDSAGMPYIVGGGSKDNMNDPSSSVPWCPSTRLVLKLFLTVRLSAAIWTVISDCDETYNYWEPLHFFLYGKGYQTWEYSPEYGLRSYLYVLLHTLPAWLYDRLLHPPRMYVFYCLRCLLGCVCVLAETYFVSGVKREMGPNAARITLAFLLFSAGMFAAGTAFLPSSTSMYLTMLSYGAWYNRKHGLAIFFTAMSAFISWPFAALIGLPVAFDIVVRRKRLMFFARWCLISTATILVPQVIIDSNYYGKTIIAPLNIITYNMFTSHGPDIYGTEPWHFYFVNGFLNFNVVFVLSLLVWPLQLLAYLLLPATSSDQDRAFIPKWLNTSALFLWYAVFFLQSHKEERFLYPVYPLMALTGACAVEAGQKLFFRLFVTRQNRHYLDHTNWMSVVTMLLAASLGLSRIVAVYNNYSAPINTWMHLSNLPYFQPEKYDVDDGASAITNVCVGKEWHRFPSSFFLPRDGWEMRFLRSEFRGQLPQPYLRGRDDATSVVRTAFNELNREEASRYEVDVAECHFLVDVEREGRETELEPVYSKSQDVAWEVESEMPFLDAERSTSRVFRAFYIPFLSQQKSVWSRYVLLRNTKVVTAPAAAAAAAKKRTKKNIRHL